LDVSPPNEAAIMTGQKTLFLHIGRAKTGSTAIQTQLKAMRSGAGPHCYPETGCGAQLMQHADIALGCRHDSLVDEAQLAALRSRFEDEVALHDSIIVSSEGFQNIMNPQRLEFFFRQGPACNYDIVTICYLREFLDVARSNFAQHVQASRYHQSFSDYCIQSSWYNVLRFFQFWDAFSDRFEPSSYERALAEHGSVIRHFSAAIGTNLAESPDNFGTNPTISGNLLAFKLLLNAMISHRREYYSALMRLASTHDRFRGAFFISSATAKRLRGADGGWNTALEDRLGEIPRRNFDDAADLLQPETWSADVEIILAEPEFESVRHLRTDLSNPTRDLVERLLSPNVRGSSL
jgi:hypothetical protein